MRIFLDIGWKRVIIVFGVQWQENTKKTKESYGCDETKSSACTKERGAMVGYPCVKRRLGLTRSFCEKRSVRPRYGQRVVCACVRMQFGW